MSAADDVSGSVSPAPEGSASAGPDSPQAAPELVDVTLTLNTVQGGVEGDSYQVVWQCLGHQGQTPVTAAGKGGAVEYGQQWLLPAVRACPAAETSVLNLALWSYKTEPAQHLAIARVSITDFRTTPEQPHVFEMAVSGQEAAMTVSLGLLAQPAGTVDAAGGASAPDVASGTCSPSASPPPLSPAKVQQPSPQAASPHSPAAAAPGRVVTLAELRQWVGGILEGVVNENVGIGSAGITDGRNFEIGHEGVATASTLGMVLDDPLLHADPRVVSHPIPLQAVEERLETAICEVYLQSTELGGRVARLLREECAERILQLLNLPRHMLRRVFSDNGACTLCALRLIQYFGMSKADGQLRQNRAERRVVARSTVLYVSEEVLEEWKETQLDQQIEFEVPLMSVRSVPAGGNGAMDVAELEKLVKADIEEGCVPAGVVARMGCDGAAASDDLGLLTNLCQGLRLWLHVEGPAVFFLGTDWRGGDPLRIATQDGALNVSIAVCEDEVPGLRKLPGFWLFSSGDDCGGWRLPQDSSPECDIISTRWFLPGYIRLRACGLAEVGKFIVNRHTEAAALVESLKQIDQAASSVTLRMFTEPSNLWNVKFSILPADHPLATHDAADVPDQMLAHRISMEGINSINRSIHRSVCGDDSDAFELRDHDGLLLWCYCVAGADLCPDTRAKLRDAVLGAAENMISAARYANEVRGRLEAIQDLRIIKRDTAENPLELCSFRMIPQFYDSQDYLSETDIGDINTINRSLQVRLAEGDCVATFGLAGDDSVSVVTCSLCAQKELPQEAVEGLIEHISTAVTDVLRNDPTVQRIEGVLIQRGIAVAEKELMSVSMNNQKQRGLIRSVPVVGGMMDWFMPVAEQDEGLHFDLTTSTLKKEGRQTEEGAAAEGEQRD